MKEDIETYLRMQKELIAKHHGKVAVFSKGKLIVIDRNLKMALKKARKKAKSKNIFVAELYTPEEQTAAILIVV